MTRALSLAAALALGLLLVASPCALAQQDPGGDAPPAQDRPAGDDLGGDLLGSDVLITPGWAGTFASDLVQVQLRPVVDDRFTGTVRVEDTSYDVQGVAVLRQSTYALEGELTAGEKQLPFTARFVEGEDTLTFETSGVTYELTRQPDEIIGEDPRGPSAPGSAAPPEAATQPTGEEGKGEAEVDREPSPGPVGPEAPGADGQTGGEL